MNQSDSLKPLTQTAITSNGGDTFNRVLSNKNHSKSQSTDRDRKRHAPKDTLYLSNQQNRSDNDVKIAANNDMQSSNHKDSIMHQVQEREQAKKKRVSHSSIIFYEIYIS